ncbi:L-histidine N(alpha)-methyltransferase [Novosphingobium olei]|uniref:L-histidine N(Alpha)-methyltransferase n=1 Tax=Novosphingobium olei TaxID=2728851 RepID=A0A7Y0BS95_9SPHN|nr:L-histidine N(alpha)-methyltransferase [Novosphingobium olei]NML95621.1 L-histidine N(alpha)-methyltransferase [Novosphingobium olei]
MTETLTRLDSPFARDVVRGLAQHRKTIPARYFYDMRGSELFEEITQLPEYYPTRTELGLLRDHAADLARFAGRHPTVIEFGAGSATKTPLLLDAVAAQTYVGIDISADFLEESTAALSASRPGLEVVAVPGDFTHALDLPPLKGERIGFFSGSTIGNFEHRAAVDLLRSFRATLGEDALLVIAIDTRKNPHLLEAAYDDAAGVTAEFNLNLLRRINRELEGTIPVEAFEHRAIWHDGLGRIEMHLVAREDVTFEAAGEHFAMRGGETIHTENSYKYTLPEARLLARTAGWEPLAFWTDEREMFGLHVWTTAKDDMQP